MKQMFYCPRPAYPELSPKVVHGLGEVDVDPSVIYQAILHLEECALCCFVGVKSNECIAKRIPSLVVPNYVT